MTQLSFAIKGDICHSLAPRQLECVEGGYAVCEDGRSAGVFRTLPEQYAGLPVLDCTGRLVLPGLVDLHVHASQFAYRGTGMDMELLDWLNACAFPEESRFADLDYAARAYGRFVEDVVCGPNTRACVFATAHVEATLLLMDMLEKSGLVTMWARSAWIRARRTACGSRTPRARPVPSEAGWRRPRAAMSGRSPC